MAANIPGFITGKPISIGGSMGRKEATGYMVVLTIREALKELNLKPENTTASIQGFGNVAQYAVELYHKIGGTVICVSSWDPADNKTFCCRKNPEFCLMSSSRSAIRSAPSIGSRPRTWDMKSFPATHGWNRMSTS